MRRKPAESAAKSRDSAVPLKRRRSSPFTGRAEPRVYPRTPGDASRISESVFQQRARGLERATELFRDLLGSLREGSARGCFTTATTIASGQQRQDGSIGSRRQVSALPPLPSYRSPPLIAGSRKRPPGPIPGTVSAGSCLILEGAMQPLPHLL